MTMDEAYKYITGTQWFATRPGLSRTQGLLDALGNPEKSLKFIHVAGTNGKGSTCAMLESLLRANGYKTGLFTSPYIVDFCERIQFCGEFISKEDLCRLTERVALVADAMEDHPTQFELITAIGFLYFLERGVDIVVLETGLGGRLDATNVIDAPIVSVITNIGMDHMEYLGDSLLEIAKEKAGIIKPGAPVVCYDNEPDVKDFFKDYSRKLGCPVYFADNTALKSLYKSLEGQRIEAYGEVYEIPLLGIHQMYNLGLVLKVVEVLKSLGYSISDEKLHLGLKDAKWPARFEVISKDPVFIIDGGHNPQCAQLFEKNLREYIGKKVTLIMGVLADKDYKKEIEIILPHVEEFICLTPKISRALPGEDLAKVITDLGGKARAYTSVSEGIEAAKATGRPVITFGSLYMAAQIREVVCTV